MTVLRNEIKPSICDSTFIVPNQPQVLPYTVSNPQRDILSATQQHHSNSVEKHFNTTVFNSSLRTRLTSGNDERKHSQHECLVTESCRPGVGRVFLLELLSQTLQKNSKQISKDIYRTLNFCAV
jgi:hypothetical protein